MQPVFWQRQSSLRTLFGSLFAAQLSSFHWWCDPEGSLRPFWDGCTRATFYQCKRVTPVGIPFAPLFDCPLCAPPTRVPLPLLPSSSPLAVSSSHGSLRLVCARARGGVAGCGRGLRAATVLAGGGAPAAGVAGQAGAERRLSQCLPWCLPPCPHRPPRISHLVERQAGEEGLGREPATLL